MLRKAFMLIGIITVLSLSVSASVIDTSPSQFAVLAGGTLSTEKGVSIDGLVGSGKNTYLGQQNHLSNNLYSKGKVSTGQQIKIDGRVISGKDVYLGKKSEVALGIDSFGNVTLDQYAQIGGNLNADRNVSLGKSALVGGDISYGNRYWADRRATVTGTAGKDIGEISTWTPTWSTAPDQWTSGSQRLYYGNKSTESLDPGDYGSLSINNDSTIYLTAGTYNFNSLWMGNGVNLIADTSDGEVIVNIVNGLSTGNDVILDSGEEGVLTFNTKGSIYLGNNTLANANFFGYRNNISIGQNSDINGSLYSTGNIWLGSNISVTGSAAGSVPEPGTCVLLITGLVALGWKKTTFGQV